MARFSAPGDQTNFWFRTLGRLLNGGSYLCPIAQFTDLGGEITPEGHQFNAVNRARIIQSVGSPEDARCGGMRSLARWKLTIRLLPLLSNRPTPILHRLFDRRIHATPGQMLKNHSPQPIRPRVQVTGGPLAQQFPAPREASPAAALNRTL